MPVPYTFANATTAIPLSQLDSNFGTAITLGNTAIQLGNTVTTLNNMTLANVTISSGTVSITNVAVTTANVSNTANISTLVVVGNTTAGGNVSVGGNVSISVNTSVSGNANVTGNISGAGGSFSSVTSSGNVTLSGGIANAVLYLNTSKVATSGTALTFDGANLGVGTSAPSQRIDSQVATTTEGSGLAVTNSQAGGYGSGLSFYSYLTDGTTKVMAGQVSMLGAASWADSANSTSSMLFKTISAGTLSERMRLTSTGLGIGTSSPSYKLQVYNNINGTPFAWGNATRTGYLYQDQNGVGITNAAGTGFDEGVYLDTANSKVVLYTNSTDRVTLDSSGNLGLGVTPSAWSVGKAMQIGTAGDLSLMGFANSAYFGANTYYNAGWKYAASSTAGRYEIIGNAHAWYTAPSGTAGDAITFTQAMTLDASGQLGIGTTSPTDKLHVDGGASSTYIKVVGQSATAYFGQDTVGLTVYQKANKPIYFVTNDTERARIDSSGNLLVGATTVGTWTSNSFGVQTSAGFTVTAHANGTASGTAYAYFDYNNSPIGSITQSGTTAVLYNVTSDQRLKENIADADSASTLIDSLQVRKFDWKSDGNHQRYGFVAQELITVAPEAVHQPAAPEEMMAVDYSKLVPMLVKEIQSLRKRLADAGIA